MQRSHQPIWAHDDGTLWELIIILLNPFEVIPRRVRLTDSPRRQIHDLVSIPADIGVKLRYTKMGPVPSDHREDVTESIRPKDIF